MWIQLNTALAIVLCLQVGGSFSKAAPTNIQQEDTELEKLFARKAEVDNFKEFSGNFLNGPVQVPKIVKGSPLNKAKPTDKREIERLWNKARGLPPTSGSLAERFERLVQQRKEQLKKDQEVLDLLRKRVVEEPHVPESESTGSKGSQLEESSKRMVETLSKRLADDFNKYFEEEMSKEQSKRGGPFVTVGKRRAKQGQRPFVYVGKDGIGHKENNNEGGPVVPQPGDAKQRLETLRGLVAKYEDYLKRRQASGQTDKYSKELESIASVDNTVEHEPFEVSYAKHGKGGFLDKTIEDISKRLKKLEKTAGVEKPQKLNKETEEILSGFGN